MKNNLSKKIARLALLMFSDVGLVVLAVILTRFFRADAVYSENLIDYWPFFIINSVVLVGAMFLAKQYYCSLSKYSAYDFLRCLPSLMLVFAIDIIASLSVPNLSRASMLLYCLILSSFIVTSRFIVRAYIMMKQKWQKFKIGGKERVLIVGAGSAADSIIRDMLSSNRVNKTPIALVDDDPAKKGTTLSGIKVVGNIDDIPSVVEKYHIQSIIVAIPTASRERLKQICEIAHSAVKKVQTLPGMFQLVNGVTLSDLKDVDLQELLGREPISVDLNEIMSYIENKVILVTGAGGSIGSELCRQIITHNPKQLIMLDIYENSLYSIQQELKFKYPNANMLALVASIRGSKKVEDVFNKYRPNIVFNAAAHKHVPLMETSPNEAIKNNVFGTLHLAEAAEKYKTDRFVQISTDKAVNPTNIMGASKRLCEMIIQAVGRKSTHCEFVAVRFGNVLGSNGSVIPLFKRQIEEGGPVTVTHREIVRYFMTIPEAVSLVLQAGAYAKGGEIYVLDMGEPVKIYDLAVNLIRLSGYKPEKDIKIVFSGLRPGEKLFEERLMSEEGLKKTANGKISVAKPIDFDEKAFFNTLPKLYEAAYAETEEMKDLVKALVPTYTIDRNC